MECIRESLSWDELRQFSEEIHGHKLPPATHPTERPEVVEIALEMIDMASGFYLNTDFSLQEAFFRLKALSSDVKIPLNHFLHTRGLKLDQIEDGVMIARTLTEFVNDILIQNGQGAPSDKELELLFCMDA
ncbi:MAG: hypothetical protein KBC64_00325 [Simkaniaceae bacterium]|nr:hypothetical protein [Simkaniaceae bacterium]